MAYKRFFYLTAAWLIYALILGIVLANVGQAKTMPEPRRTPAADAPYTITVPQEIKDAATPKPEATLIPTPMPTPTPEASRGGYNREDILLIAKLIWEEARGESYEGMVAVGEVVLNRVEYDAWSDTVQGVIYQPKQFAPISGQYNETTLQAAMEAVGGSQIVDGAQYFFNPDKCDPEWANDLDFVCRIGGHVFYGRPE